MVRHDGTNHAPVTAQDRDVWRVGSGPSHPFEYHVSIAEVGANLLPTMSTVRSLCSEVRGDPVLMRRINGWLTIAWIVMIPVSIALGWIHSVAYVSALSLWALVSGHWSAWQAARVEVEQHRQQRELIEHPPEERVVEAIVEQTTVDRIDATNVRDLAVDVDG